MSYNNLGLVTTIKNDATNGLIWQGDELNSKGLYTKYTLGNSIQTTRTFDNFGQINSEVAGNVFDHHYDFNIYNGNLNSLNDNIKGLNETYTYDGLDRLKTSTVGDAFGPLLPPLTLTYDLAGNITNKSDVGDYKYLATKPNAVQFVKNPNNIISQMQQDITYSAFEKAVNITENQDEQAVITYGPNQERVKTQFSNIALGANYSTRYYLSNYEKEVKTGMTREVHYINAPSGLVAMHVIENGVSNTYFTYSDHLGTLKTITNANGNVVAEQNFDPWGQRRNPSTWDYSSVPTPPAWLFRGFTGHEHLPQFSLINMNGRMYDPQNGRMLSADPILHDATSTQAYNKYSYCINNPLKYTDPSGYDFKLQGKNNEFVFYVPFTNSTGSSWRDDPTVVKGINGMPIGGNGKEYSSFGDFGFNLDNEEKHEFTDASGDSYKYQSEWLELFPATYLTPWGEEGQYGEHSWTCIGGSYVSTKAKSSRGVELLSTSTYGASNSTEFNSGSGTPYFNDVSDQTMFPGVAIYETPIASGGITLVGPNKTAVIFVHPNASTALKQHEYGHYLDMKYGSGTLGILPNDLTFNILMGIPSLINGIYDSSEGHKYFYTELSANQFSFEFFSNQGTLAKDYNYPTTPKK